LNRPERRNALSATLLAALHREFDVIAADADGAHARHAGAHGVAVREGAPAPATGHPAVNGPAVGGGFAFALACDIRFSSTAGRYGAVFIARGVSACDMGTSYFLPRLVGASRAAELMLTGRVFDADEAHAMGLVLDVVPDGKVVARALTTARLNRRQRASGRVDDEGRCGRRSARPAFATRSTWRTAPR
jgi:enoyl-CoA hydratase/carnithine racemase